MHWYLNIPSPCKSIHTTDTIVKSLILPGPLLWNLALHQNLYIYKFRLNWILFPMTKNDILWNKIKNSRISTSAKLGLFTNQQILQKKFIVTLTETLVCWVIRSWVIQVYTIHKSSQLLSVWSISAHIQYIFNAYSKNTIIFDQIDFVANFL